MVVGAVLLGYRLVKKASKGSCGFSMPDALAMNVSHHHNRSAKTSVCFKHQYAPVGRGHHSLWGVSKCSVIMPLHSIDQAALLWCGLLRH